MKITITKPNGLTEARIKKGYSIRRLAQVSGINPVTILRIEKGESCPNPSTAKAICDSLAINFDSLFVLKEG